MNNIYKHLWLAALPLAFAACQNEEIVDEQATGKGLYTLHCTVEKAAQSRAQVVLNNNEGSKETFMWNNGDCFSLYSLNGGTDIQNSVFKIDDNYDEWNAPSSSASFTAIADLEDGDDFIAIYPRQYSNSIVNFSIQPVISNYFDSNHWRNYMRENMLMTAQGTLDGANTNVSFEQQAVIARFTYTNAASENYLDITQLTMKGDGNYFANTFVADLNEKTFYTSNAIDSCYVRYDYGSATAGPGGALEFYLLFFPGEAFNEDGVITISTSSKFSSRYATSIDISTSDILAANEGATGFEAGKRYWFKLALTDDGLIWTKDLKKEMVGNKELFKAIEESAGVQFAWEGDSIDVNQNSSIFGNITHLDIIDKGLTSLEGIEYFKKLDWLNCSHNQLETLDLSALNKLHTLNCSNNQISSLTLPTDNTSFYHLNCQNNQLTTLDVSTLTTMQEFYFTNNEINSIDLSANTSLIRLWCGENPLTDLSVVSELTSLEELHCSKTQISSIDLSANTSLKFIWCEDNPQLDGLDVSALTALEELHCNHTKLSSTDLSANINLKRIWCEDSQISGELNVSTLDSLIIINCSYNEIDKLDVTNSEKLNEVRCYSNLLTSLDFSQNYVLKELHCYNNQLTELKLFDLPINLENIHCQDNKLTSLDVSGCVNLKQLECHQNQLDALDVSMNTALEGLRCGQQQTAEGERKTLILTLSEIQQELWDNNWINWGGNDSVQIFGQEPSNTSGNGNNLSNGGVY